MTARIGPVLGLTTLLILSACGSLRPDARVGELVSFDALEDGESAQTEFLMVELADGEQPEDVFDDWERVKSLPCRRWTPSSSRTAVRSNRPCASSRSTS